MPEFSMKPSDVAGDLEDVAAVGDAPLAPSHAIASLALSMAMKYADINTVQEGALYQQYKLEGRNIQNLSLDYVFYIADQIEKRLLFSPNRLAQAALEDAYEQVEEVLSEELAEGAAEPQEGGADDPNEGGEK